MLIHIGNIANMIVAAANENISFGWSLFSMVSKRTNITKITKLIMLNRKKIAAAAVMLFQHLSF